VAAQGDRRCQWMIVHVSAGKMMAMFPSNRAAGENENGQA
jgi:hypothetical protein